MFPALTSEFIKAENQYRHDRTHRSLLDHRALRPSRRRAAGGARPTRRPTVDAATWTPRSA